MVKKKVERYIYPAIFNFAEEGGYFVTFPDFPECITEGDDLQDAYEMTVDALGLAVTSRMQDGEQLPSATDLNKITTTPGQSIVIVEFDIDEYNRKHNSKAVKKTLTIPEWMNDEGIRLGINFSHLLQDALREHINSAK